MLKIVTGITLALSLGACATSNNKSNYDSYLKTVQQIESNKAVSEEASRIAKSQEYKNMQEGCKDSSCVSTVAAFKAISDVVDSLSSQIGGGRSNGIAAPQREPTFSEQLLGWAQVLVPGVTTYTGIVETNKTQRHLSDNQTIERQSQNTMFSTMFTQQSTALGQAAASPNIVVGGNYGNTATTTNTAGNNLVSGNDNTIGRNNGNSGRITSDGPYDNSGDCRDGDSNCPVITPTP